MTTVLSFSIRYVSLLYQEFESFFYSNYSILICCLLTARYFQMKQPIIYLFVSFWQLLSYSRDENVSGLRFVNYNSSAEKSKNIYNFIVLMT